MASQSLLVAFLSVVVLLVEGGVFPLMSPPADNKIFRGEEIDISKVPWQVAILYDSKLNCGGSIISKDWIVTAAHCTSGYDYQLITLRVGSNTYESGGEEYKVAHVVIHPNYERVSLYNDVSVIRTSRPINLDGVVPATVQLPTPGAAQPHLTGTVTVSGWGRYGSSDEASPKLKAARNVVVDFSYCQMKYHWPIPQEVYHFCAQEKTGISCKGDSGGPVTVGNLLVGIVSGGGSACGEGPSYYVRVVTYRNWIKMVTGV